MISVIASQVLLGYKIIKINVRKAIETEWGRRIKNKNIFIQIEKHIQDFLKHS